MVKLSLQRIVDRLNLFILKPVKAEKMQSVERNILKHTMERCLLGNDLSLTCHVKSESNFTVISQGESGGISH